MPMYILQD